MERCGTLTDWRVPYLEKQMVVYAREASVLSFKCDDAFCVPSFLFLKAERQLECVTLNFMKKKRRASSSAAFTATFCQTNPHPRTIKITMVRSSSSTRSVSTLAYRFGLRSKTARRGVASVRVDAFDSLFLFLLARFREIFVVPVECAASRDCAKTRIGKGVAKVLRMVLLREIVRNVLLNVLDVSFRSRIARYASLAHPFRECFAQSPL